MSVSSMPSLLSPRFDTMPAELTTCPQWVVWRAVWQPEKNKYSKVPHDAKTGKAASSTDPATWATFEQTRVAYEAGNGKYAGVGFVLSSDDPFSGVDLDHAIHGKELSDEAQSVVLSLKSYAEVSPSGTGLRVFVQAALPPGGRKRGDTEMYENGRFLTVTGRRLPVAPASVNARQDELAAFHAEVFPPVVPKAEPRHNTTVTADLLADAELLHIAMNAKNGAKIAALYAGDLAGYPGASEADLALCTLLGFYSGGDAVRLDGWFRTSGLMRDKWDETHYSGGETYGERTVKMGIDAQNGQFYTPRQAGQTASVSSARKVVANAPVPSVVDDVPWPEPIGEEAYHGLLGRIVRAIEPHTESDPHAVLVQTLVAFGNVGGRYAHVRVEGDQHFPNLFCAVVGTSSKGRKGTSWGNVRGLMAEAEPFWADERVKSGLSSGEGLIHAVRDGDDGDDKRLLVVESELASVLRVMERDGNTVSARLRDAWDTGKLSTLTKTDPVKATGAHISIVGHITRDELLRYLRQTETANGFANRFLWVCAKRSKLLPDGGSFYESPERHVLAEDLRDAATFAQTLGRVQRSPDARALWHELYPALTGDVPGLLGSVTSRAEAQVTRLALLYALLDKSPEIQTEHLLAAVAVWEYAEASARFIFGDALGDADADTILQLLRSAGMNGATRTALSSALGRNKPAEQLQRALDVLQNAGRARSERTVAERGAPTETWFAV